MQQIKHNTVQIQHDADCRHWKQSVTKLKYQWKCSCECWYFNRQTRFSTSAQNNRGTSVFLLDEL